MNTVDPKVRDTLNGRAVYVREPVRRYGFITDIHPLERAWMHHDKLYFLPVEVDGAVAFYRVEDMDLIYDR